jgi:hypothetical protein
LFSCGRREEEEEEKSSLTKLTNLFSPPLSLPDPASRQYSSSLLPLDDDEDDAPAAPAKGPKRPSAVSVRKKLRLSLEDRGVLSTPSITCSMVISRISLGCPVEDDDEERVVLAPASACSAFPA